MLDAPNADLFLPERGFELLPVLAVRLLDIGTLLEQALKDKVLDQIGGGQNCTTCIECLEDLLGVLGRGQVDDYDLQELTRASLDRFGLGETLRRVHAMLEHGVTLAELLTLPKSIDGRSNLLRLLYLLVHTGHARLNARPMPA